MDWISSKLKIPLDFRPSEILFGVEGENNQAKLINCVLLCIRFYIYKSRISGNLPTTNEALLYIRTVCLSEKKNSQKKIRNYINIMENGVVYDINRYIVWKHPLEFYVCYVCYLSALRMCNCVCLVFCFFFLFCVGRLCNNKHIYIKKKKYFFSSAKSIVNAVLQSNEYFADHENFLLSIVTDEKQTIQERCLRFILKARSEHGMA